VIHRFYAHNFRCLENFRLSLAGQPSVLLIGNNGSGKTTVGLALELLQRIARGENRVADLVKPADFSRGRSDVPMRFEIGVGLKGKRYEYTIAFEMPRGSKELLIAEEQLLQDGKLVYSRKRDQDQLALTPEASPFNSQTHWAASIFPLANSPTARSAT